jgi:hypothetical protein
MISENEQPAASPDFLAGIQKEISKSSPDFPSELPSSDRSPANSAVKILGQGLIAASVAVIALTLSFNLLNTEEASDSFDVAAQTADSANLTAQNSAAMNFTGELDPEEIEQISGAVSRGLEDYQSLEVPVRFSLDDYQE